MQFDEVEKAIIQLVANHWDSFSSSVPSQNATWVKSKKRCFKGSHVTLDSF